MGGADIIRQALRAGQGAVDLDRPSRARRREAAVRGFNTTVGLEPMRVLQSPFATHISYRVVR